MEANSVAEVARLVGVVFAALVTLGLAALQKTDGPGSPVTRAANVDVVLTLARTDPRADRGGAGFAGYIRRGCQFARTERPSHLSIPTHSVPRVVEIDHDGRSCIRDRALQVIRFPARRGSCADLRRRPLAAQHGALQDNCIKATFFEIGEHATWRRDLSREVATAGMTIGSHTWSHKDLTKNPYAKHIEQAKQEIQMGVSAVQRAVGGPIAPFFRFPDLQ